MLIFSKFRYFSSEIFKLCKISQIFSDLRENFLPIICSKCISDQRFFANPLLSSPIWGALSQNSESINSFHILHYFIKFSQKPKKNSRFFINIKSSLQLQVLLILQNLPKLRVTRVSLPLPRHRGWSLSYWTWPSQKIMQIRLQFFCWRSNALVNNYFSALFLYEVCIFLCAYCKGIKSTFVIAIR